ncbi:MAG: hypothetical protein ABA06_01600 [Parcubacteria bacterium C7867-001]|nr:MAG: hypothetical protein ABA06_01600 [Parcubacteria bacterium C7867-001]
MYAQCALCKSQKHIDFGVQLRIVRLKLTDPSLSGKYQKLARLVPLSKLFDKKNHDGNHWFLTPAGTDGWSFFSEAEHPLSNEDLRALWLEEAIEIQKKSVHGEWSDVFTLP